MRLVVDANILVGELMRSRGRLLINDSRLELFIAAKTWDEALYEIGHRVEAFVRVGRLDAMEARDLASTMVRTVVSRITVIQDPVYAPLELIARRRIPRDPDDWPTVAVALFMDVGIWTLDGDFLGCGCPTWTTDTLLAEISQWV